MAGGTKKKRVARGSKKKKGAVRDVVADLTDDVLVDILSRVPVKSLCLCKSVCRRWRDLISDPDHGKKLPQTLAGFFYGSYDTKRFLTLAGHFISVSGDPVINPSLSFLPKYESIDFVDGCNGLLLCRGWKPTHPVTLDYLVCNPATEKWVVVPDSGWSRKAARYEQYEQTITRLGFDPARIARLGFDPAVSTHFHVFELIPDHVLHMDDREMDVSNYYRMLLKNNCNGSIQVVATYSSNTGIWSLKEEHFNWNGDGGFGMRMAMGSKGVFFNGVLHLASCHGLVLAIDVAGNILRGIPAPMPPDYDNYIREKFGDVYLSQGHLYFAARRVADGSNDYGLSVWVLEDYNSENWSLKHNFNILDLFGAHYYSVFRDNFKVISIHPERNVIFMVCGTDRTLMCYEMDHRRLRFVSRLGSHCSTPYIPYVPLFSGSMADGH
ncbi:hypothetical protein HU200_058847 [Digitaria exilis]|uniref:F-box domain-containing protein n=1 Tax=Digitaria exilis TaxID=1010633 RepID=A0A835A942_9POAL|nr:hypothetical protein HU200_058847 [Digitaria exilis]